MLDRAVIDRIVDYMRDNEADTAHELVGVVAGIARLLEPSERTGLARALLTVAQRLDPDITAGPLQ